MKMPRNTLRITPCLALVIAIFGSLPSAQAVEPVREFIDGLRLRGYYDVAIDYMELMKDSPDAPDDFKKYLLYEQGSMLVDLARSTGDTKLREEAFAQAEAKLQAFAKANPNTDLSAKANTQLANVMVERGRNLVTRGESPGQAANKTKLNEEARGFFDKALETFGTSEKFYDKALDGFPKTLDPNKDEEQYELRQAYRGELVQMRLLLATVVYEKAKTFPEGDKQRNELLQTSADQYGELYEKYRKWGAGLYARLYQGRSYQEMKKYKDALTYYEDLIMQESDEPFLRTLASKAYVQVAQCFNAEKKYDATIEKTEKWLRSARGPEIRSPEILALKYEVALAYKAKMDIPEEAKNVNKYKREGRELLKDIIRLPGELQKAGKELYASFTGGEGEAGEAETFADAFDLAKEALQVMDVKEKLLPQLKKENPEEAAKTEKEVVENRDKAIKLFNDSLKLVDSETDVQKINLVRYFLCFLNYKSEKMYEAAILGEFLARKYPDSAGARQGAKIAMASYVASYSSHDKAWKDYDARRVIDVAELIAKQWEGQPEADEAYMLLVGFNLQVGRFDSAVAALESIPPDSANRGKAELQIGQSMWTRYLKALKLPADSPDRPAADALPAMKKQAQETLQAGVTRMKGQGASATAANASLSLAQIYLDGGEYEKSIGVLEDAELGPLVLVNNKFPHAMQPGYAEAAYKAALRAYVSIQPPQQEKAEQVMDALEKHVTSSGDAEAKETLTKIFISLGLELERQIEAMQQEGKQDEILAVSKSFEAFLDRISGRDAGNDWATRNWIASTYFSLGKGADTGGAQSAAIRGYYDKARAAYQKILDEAKSGKITPPSPTSVAGVTVRLAECLKQLGDFKAALDIYGNILGEKPTLLDVQFDAANAFLQQGMAEGSDDAFKAAIFGGSLDPKTKKPRIWGWGKLSATLARYYSKPGFGEKFHRARQLLTETRLEWARTTKDTKRAKGEFERAEKDIIYVYKLYPAMGSDLEGGETQNGETLRDGYDDLLKRAQKALGKKADGLKALGPPPNAVAN